MNSSMDDGFDYSNHEFMTQFVVHPAFPLLRSSKNSFLAELLPHCMHCLASQVSVERWRAMFCVNLSSQAHAQQWNVIGIAIRLHQRRALLCRGALCAFLVQMLLRVVQKKCSVRHPLNLAKRILSQRHFLGSKKSHSRSLYEDGRRLCGQQRYSDAAERWSQAALLQHGPSHAYLSDMLLDGRPHLANDAKRAFQVASAGAALGCAHSKGALGRCLVTALSTGEVDQDAKLKKRARMHGLALGRQSAAAGSCFGQTVVGLCYRAGLSVSKDKAEAVRLFRLAAAQGHAEAQYSLGNMFLTGKGVRRDDEQAVRLFRLAAVQGHANAQYSLGGMLGNGRGVALDRAEGMQWLRMAAAQGHSAAIMAIGMMELTASRYVPHQAASLRALMGL
jgi:TPR repeat protein